MVFDHLRSSSLSFGLVLRVFVNSCFGLERLCLRLFNLKKTLLERLSMGGDVCGVDLVLRTAD